LSFPEAAELVQYADRNGDGEIDYAEFIKMLTFKPNDGKAKPNAAPAKRK
jgi:Ca2+-binding EF-hand superfamily protein